MYIGRHVVFETSSNV